jgi:ATP-dependent Zn protease
MFHKATEILSQQRTLLDNAASTLLQKETLAGEDLAALREAVPSAA